MQVLGTLRFQRVHSHNWAMGRIVPLASDFRQLQELFAAQGVPYTGEVAVCGEPVVHMRPGGTYAMECEFSVHPRFGPQLKIFGATPHMGAGTHQLVSYLEQNFEGVGGLTAKKAVAWYEAQGRLDEFREYVQSNPAQIDLTQALGRKKASVYRARESGTFFDAIAVQLSRDHLKAQVRPGAWSALAKKIGMLVDSAWERYVQTCRRLSAEDAKKVPMPPIQPRYLAAASQMFRDNPYAAIGYKARGYTFDEADRVAALLNIARDDPRRLSALGEEAVLRRCRADGHTYVTYRQFEDAVRLMDPTVQPQLVLECSRTSLVPLVVEKDRIYVQALYVAEQTAAAALQRMLIEPAAPLGRKEGMNERLSAMQEHTGIQLDPSQREALLAMLQSETRIHTLTAGPGRGKTTVVQMLVAEAEANGKHGLYAAPTGKAAKVLADRLRRPVSTIHRMLGPSPTSIDGFTYGRAQPLPADFVVLDETSMLDIELASVVFSAIDAHAHLILLGDPGQLPSVGPGIVLSDVLRLEADRHTLHKTHRNTGAILSLIDAIGDGTLVQVAQTEDVVVVAPQYVDAQASLEELVDLFLREVEDKGFDNVSLITPKRAGHAQTPGWNTTYLNAAIQARVNPSGERVPGLPFVRVGDRILVRQNVYAGFNRESIVVNGDTGVLVDYSRDPKGMLSTIAVQLDSGERAVISAASLDSPEDIDRVIDLGYALTVHAAQGSEYGTVIFAVQQHSRFVDRRMVYTAVSRAKRKLVVFGSPYSLVEASRIPGSPRQSFLVEKAGASSEVAQALLRAKKGW